MNDADRQRLADGILDPELPIEIIESMAEAIRQWIRQAELSDTRLLASAFRKILRPDPGWPAYIDAGDTGPGYLCIDGEWWETQGDLTPDEFAAIHRAVQP